MIPQTVPNNPMNGAVDPTVAKKVKPFSILDICFSIPISSIPPILSTKFALYVFEATRYRMKYLEKYVFDMIPDITLIPDFPVEINDKTLKKYFNLNCKEVAAIEKHTKKNYLTL